MICAVFFNQVILFLDACLPASCTIRCKVSASIRKTHTLGRLPLDLNGINGPILSLKSVSACRRWHELGPAAGVWFVFSTWTQEEKCGRQAPQIIVETLLKCNILVRFYVAELSWRRGCTMWTHWKEASSFIFFPFFVVRQRGSTHKAPTRLRVKFAGFLAQLASLRTPHALHRYEPRLFEWKRLRTEDSLTLQHGN